ncbi:hypothetical protein LG634_07405 [Streptomyces bambusae]|nr:hypothetical protein [Streptomyces bambusae]MCB5164659.1 hypothetical protein [Streptomyces bambusae]
MTYGPPGQAVSTTELQLVVSGSAGRPEANARTSGAVTNLQLFPVSDFELSTVYAHFSDCNGELRTVPQAMWLCTSPKVCTAAGHGCDGVLGRAFAAYDRIHILACRGGADSGNAVVEALIRETSAFLDADYATTLAAWERMDETERSRYLGFEGVILWYQVHSGHLRAAAAEGEFALLQDFQSAMPKDCQEILRAAGDTDEWPWVLEYKARLRAETEFLVDLERSFTPAVWSGLSEAGRTRALEVYREWGPGYLDSVRTALRRAGLVVPGQDF